MAGSGRKWLVGCGVGCAVTALLAIVVTVGGGIILTRPFTRAADSQQELNERFGAREDFQPSLATFERDRLKAFMAVRRELVPICAEFEAVAAKFAAVEKLDEGGDDPSAGEAIRTVLPVIGAAFGIAGKIGRHNELRNRALLDQDMSLGEYVWYYVLVYNSWLGYAPNQEFDDSEGAGDYTRSERRVILALLEHHAEALRDAGRTAEADLWAAEAGAILDSPTGVPFGPGGLPEAYARFLEPWRGKLEPSYCAATSSFELNRIRKKGLSFHSE
jgi:hypothetical protein